MRAHAVAAAGLSLHVVEYDGAGPPMLAVHGTGHVGRIWRPVAVDLAAHFRVFALDRRGHGESDKPADGYELEDSVPDVVAVVERLGLDGAVALGHSSGATVLALAAARHPGLFSRLVLVDPIIFAPRGPESGSSLARRLNLVERTARRRAEWPSAQAMFDDLRDRATFRTWRPESLWDYVHHGAARRADGAVALRCPPALEAAMYRHASRLDLLAEVARIDVPVAILRAALTDRLPRASAERAARENPRVTLMELPGLTHFAPMEDPAAIAAAARAFLTGSPAAARATCPSA